jgi:hypothetical protein
MVLVAHLKLVFNAVPPEIVFGEMGQSAHLAASEEILGELQALDLVHGFHLLVTLGACLLQNLIFVFYTLDLTFDFFLPAIVERDLSLLVLGLKFTNFIKLGLLLYLK